jgi:hypothetical protein
MSKFRSFIDSKPWRPWTLTIEKYRLKIAPWRL